MTEDIEKYADCMNDDEAIRITKKYCYDPNSGNRDGGKSGSIGRNGEWNRDLRTRRKSKRNYEKGYFVREVKGNGTGPDSDNKGKKEI